MNRPLSSASRSGFTGKRASNSPARAANALPPAQRVFFERAFGQDFSQVRVHTDAGAHTLAGALGAKAVTHGDDIAFAPGRYQPDSAPGRTLLAHELAHVAQQRQGGGAPAQAEQRARSAADTASQGGQVAPESLGGADPGLHCDPDDDKKDQVDKPWMPGSALPPLKLTTPGPLDWMKLRESFTNRGLSMSLRDADSIAQEAKRIADQLAVFGIGPSFKFDYKLGTLSRDDIINLGLSKQLENQLGSEHPNFFDRTNKDWKLNNPGDTTIPLFSKTWKF